MTSPLHISHKTFRLGLAALLAPLASAQLGDMQFISGPLGFSSEPALADMTGNGELDLILFSAVETAGEIGIFRAQGPAAYSSIAVLLPGQTGTVRGAFLADDLDDDGDMDLWVSERDAPSPAVVTAYLNQGDGEFSAATSFETGFLVESIRCLDIDGDGISDLSLDTEIRGAGYLKGQPGGGLLAFQPYFAGDYRHGPLRFGDLDGDGDQDFLGRRADIPGSFTPRVYTFTNPGSFPIDPALGVQIDGSSPADVAELEDFDGDGDLDAVVGPLAGAVVNLYENAGGTLTNVGPVFTNFIFNQDLLIADADGDGDKDLIFQKMGALGWRENVAGMTFAPEATIALGEPLPAVLEDLTADGVNDYVFLDSFPGQAAELYLRFGDLQSGSLGLSDQRIALVDAPGRETPCAFDADGDGLDDLVFALDNAIAWKRATGGGAYALAVEIADVPAQTIPPVGGDFDGDGLDDVVYSPAASTALAFLKGDGSGSFAPPVFSALPSSATSLIGCDLDQDGIEDIIVTRSNGSAVGVVLGTTSGVFSPMNNVGGNFGGPVVPVPIEANGDGRIDLMFSTDEVVELALQNASGLFPTRSVVVDATGLTSFLDLIPPAAGDIDMDGATDIVVCVANTVRAVAGQGDGTFGPLQLLVQDTSGIFGELRLTRIDANSSLDLLTRGNSFGDPPRWSPNLGAGSFGAFQLPEGEVQEGTNSIHLADVDGDADMDIVSTSFSNRYVLTRNIGNGPLGTNYCGPAIANSSGQSAALSASGSADLAANSLTLRASNLPQDQFGFFVNSQAQGLVTAVPNSIGTLCLSGAIGRFNRSGEILFSGLAGEFTLAVDLTSVPTPSGDVVVMPGETWNFQAWFRDTDGMGGPTSNFTDGLEIQF